MKISRPFAGSHWSLFFGLIVFWCVLILYAGSYSCPPSSPYLMISLLVFILSTTLVSLWKNHVLYMTHKGFVKLSKIVVHSLYDVLSMFLILFFLLGFLSVGMGGCYTPRAKIAEMLFSMAEIRTTISERFQTSKTLTNIGHDLVIQPSERIAGGVVLPDGTIIAVSEDPPAVIIIRPTVDNEELNWSCAGAPAEVMPSRCREPLTL